MLDLKSRKFAPPGIKRRAPAIVCNWTEIFHRVQCVSVMAMCVVTHYQLVQTQQSPLEFSQVVVKLMSFCTHELSMLLPLNLDININGTVTA